MKPHRLLNHSNLGLRVILRREKLCNTREARTREEAAACASPSALNNKETECVEYATTCVQDDTKDVQDASRRYECVQHAAECAQDATRCVHNAHARR